MFHLYALPTVSSLTPSSGPIAGGTFVRVFGIFQGALQPSCWFVAVGQTVPASLDSVAQDSMICQAPIGVTAGPSALEVTLNAQQFTVNRATFTFYNVQHVSSITPASGPTSGSTLLVVAGHGFWSSRQLRCRSR